MDYLLFFKKSGIVISFTFTLERYGVAGATGVVAAGAGLVAAEVTGRTVEDTGRLVV